MRSWCYRAAQAIYRGQSTHSYVHSTQQVQLHSGSAAAKVSDSTHTYVAHSSTVKHREDCRRSSSGCSVTLSPGGARPRCTVQAGVFQCNGTQSMVAQSAAPEQSTTGGGNSLVVHHSGAPQPAPWWDQSVTGGTNPGPREPPCPGQPRPRTLLG